MEWLGRVRSVSYRKQIFLVICFILTFVAVIRLMAYPGWIKSGRTVNTQRHDLSARAGRGTAMVILSQLPVYLRNLLILSSSFRLRIQLLLSRVFIYFNYRSLIKVRWVPMEFEIISTNKEMFSPSLIPRRKKKPQCRL